MTVMEVFVEGKWIAAIHVIHDFTVAMWVGTALWMTFFSGIMLFRHLNRVRQWSIIRLSKLSFFEFLILFVLCSTWLFAGHICDGSRNPLPEIFPDLHI